MLQILTFLVGLTAISVGLLLSPIPRNLGFYKWVAQNVRYPEAVGTAPAYLDEKDWGFTFEQLYNYDLRGQTALVTGGNSGTGYATALALTRLGASVTIACRSEGRCLAAVETIKTDRDYKGHIEIGVMDTSQLASVKNFAATYMKSHEKLDMLFLNAGIGSAGVNDDGSAPLSEDGIEMVFATNHVGHHLLYKLLEPLVLKSPLARIVLTSSGGSFTTFEYKVATDLETLNTADVKRLENYGQSKLAQVLWAKELTRRLGPNSSVHVNAAHPGAVNTGIWEKNPLIPKKMMGIINYFRTHAMWTAAEGALTLLYLGVATDQLVAKNIRGKYFHPQSIEIVNPLALDEDLQKKVWDFSDELVQGYKLDPPPEPPVVVEEEVPPEEEVMAPVETEEAEEVVDESTKAEEVVQEDAKPAAEVHPGTAETTAA